MEKETLPVRGERKDRLRKKRQVSDKEAMALNEVRSMADQRERKTGRLEGARRALTRTNSSRTIKTNDPVASTGSSPALSSRPGLTAG